MDNYTLESFINYCDDMMIAEEGVFDNVFHKKTLAQVKQKLKEGETKFTCELDLNGETIPCNVDVSRFTGKIFPVMTILNSIRYLLNSGRYIKRAINYKYFDKTGMPWSKKGDRVKDMKYQWKSIDLVCERRNELVVDGTLYIENIGKTINYSEIKSLVDKFIADDEKAAANAQGFAAGYAAGSM